MVSTKLVAKTLKLYTYYMEENYDFAGIFQGQVLPDRIFHSYIFSGSDPVELEKYAMGFISKLLPEAPLATHPDFFVLDCSQADISDLREYLIMAGKTAFLGNRKVMLLTHADELNVACQNLLLKSLEEPKLTDTFVLLGNSGSFLPTVLSRCHVVNLQNSRSVSHDPAMQKLVDELAVFSHLTVLEKYTLLESLVELQTTMVREVIKCALSKTQDLAKTDVKVYEHMGKLLSVYTAISSSRNTKLLLQKLI